MPERSLPARVLVSSFFVVLLLFGSATAVRAQTAPSIASLTPSHAPTAGGFTLTIHGENFGATAGTVQLCGADAPVSSWTATQVLAVAPECVPGSSTLTLTTADGTGSVESTLRYDSPVITDLQPTSLPTAGGVRLTIHGGNFGRQSGPRSVSVGGAVAEEQEWRGHDELVVVAPPVLPGRTVPVCVQAGTAPARCADASTDPVEVTSVTPDSGPTSGGIRLTIRGRSFGVAADTPRSVRLSGAAASDVQHLGDDFLTAILPGATDPGAVDVEVEVDGALGRLPGGFTYETTVGVEALPTRFSLYGNEPNPFAARTTIAMGLPRTVDYVLTIYDLRGREVRQLRDAAGPGRVLLRWDGTDAQGARLASGVYFYRLRAGEYQQTRRMLLVR